MTNLRPTHARTLAAIAAHLDEHGYGPRLSELDPNPSAARARVAVLAGLGLVTYTPRVARSIRLTPRGRAWLAANTPAVSDRIEQGVQA